MIGLGEYLTLVLRVRKGEFMYKKIITVIVSVCLLFLIAFSISGICNKENNTMNENSLIIRNNFENKSVKSLLITNYETNEYITVGQILTFFNRINGRNVNDYVEVKKFAFENNVFLPSYLVYDIKEWENMWRNIMLNDVGFENIDNETYALNLIDGYLTVYLNQQGYDIIRQGLIPPQLYFYSPFSNITDLTDINLTKQASLGFILDVLMSLEVQENKKNIIEDKIVTRVERITGKSKENWSNSEISLYDYYALGFYGEYAYFKDKGYIDDIEYQNIMNNVSVNELLILIDKMYNFKN